jgi:hypothetical protein
MATKIHYTTSARLTWQDVSKISTGVGYLRGQPEFKGTLAEAIRKYAELSPANRPFAHIYLDPQSGTEKANVLGAREIETIRKRPDFPKQ